MADEAPLTVSSLVAELSAPPPEEKVEAQPAPETESQSVPTDETANEPETAIEGEHAETQDGEEGEESEPQAIKPPQFWDTEQKKAFSELPPHLQAIVVAKEAERDKATSRAIQEAAENRKKFDTEASRVAATRGNIDKVLAQATEVFKSQWAGGENIDWNAVVDQHGLEAATKLRNNYERDRSILQQLHVAKQEADTVNFQEFVKAETAKLPTYAPELVDPKEGPKRRVELGNYLLKNGVPTEAIKHMSALETALAYKAFKYDQAQSQANTLATQKPAATPSKTPVRPTASPIRGSQETARIRSLQAAFDKNPSRNNLIALEEARGL